MKALPSTLAGVTALAAVAATMSLGSTPAHASCADVSTDLLAEINQRGTIRIGYVNSKPYQFKNEEGELEGVIVNAAQKLADELLQVDIEWVEAKWDTMIAGLQSEKYDIIMSNVARRPNRAESVWFTKPWIIGAQSFLVREDDDIQNKADIDQPGNTVVVRLGSAAHITYTENNPDFFEHAEIKSLAPPALPEQEVASGRAVAWGAGMTETGQVARANPDWAESIILPETPRSVGAGFVVPQCQHNLLHYMNIFMDTLIESRFFIEQAEQYPDLVVDAIVAPTQTMGDLDRVYGEEWNQ